MTLLAQIQAAALDSTRTLADLLRLCLVLAYRLDHPPFRAWVEHELNGYPPEVALPPYREKMGELRANVAGPLHMFQNNVPVPMSEIPETDRETLRNFDLRQGVGELESLIAQRPESTSRLMRSIPMELCASVTVYVGWSTIRMWSEISTSMVSGVLDVIRTRALTFALEIEKVNPAAGEAPSAKVSIADSVVTQIFNTVIQGGVVSVGGGSASGTAISVQPGDLNGLRAFLLARAIPDKEIERLVAELEGSHTDPVRAREGALEWASRVGKAIAGSAGRVAEASLTAALTSAVKGYLGQSP